MAKAIRECLLEQAGKFHQWQEITYPGKTTEEIGSAWEIDYPAWNDIFDAFCHVLTQMNAEMADSILLDEMVYLIARANEAEGFIQETTSHPQWFECLCRRAAASNENEAKWQFAAYLPECPCSQEVKDMILDFAKDTNEYVSRRALLAMPALRPDCVEQFAPLFWERNCYSLELQEYQRIAVLVSLDAIHSDLLPQYLEQAKQDGRRYLLEHAKRIEGELTMNETLTSPAYHGMFGTARDAVDLFEEIQGVPMADSSYRDALARYLYLGEREKALQTAERLATSRLWAVAGPTQVRPMSFFEDPNLREFLLEPESLRRIREAAIIDDGSLIRK